MYAMLDLGIDSTAKSIFNQVKQRLIDDQLYDHMKSNLVAVVTDAGSKFFFYKKSISISI